MKSAWIIFVIYLLVKVSVLGARHINKQDHYSFNQTTYSSTNNKGTPDWFIPLVKRINEEGNDLTKKIERLEKGHKTNEKTFRNLGSEFVLE